MLRRRALLRAVDTAAIEAAIARAEAGSAGEIRVALAPFFWGSVRRTAARAFTRLGIAGTRGRTGVLIFVVPSRRRFAILGDVGIDARVGPGFWEAQSRRLAGDFAAGRFTEGLCAVIAAIGERLGRELPAAAGDPNELADAVVLLP